MNEEQKETLEKIKVMQAFVEGKQLQVKNKISPYNWKDCGDGYSPNWCWGSVDYRIKPVPREVWLVPVRGVMYESTSKDPEARPFREVLP